MLQYGDHSYSAWFWTSPSGSASSPSPSILVTTVPPSKAPPTWKLIFSSEWQSQAQAAQIVQMLQRQMQQTWRNPEVQATQATPVTEPPDRNRARGKQVEPMVTVAVKNIPRHYSQDMFMDQVKMNGFEGLFNLLYLPWNSQSGTNKGVGFVNFILPHHAQRFQKDMEGKYFDEEHMQNGLAIQIERADVQGLKANRARFTKESDFGPWLSKTKQVVPLLEIGIWAGIPRRRKEGQTEPLVEI